jgi:hypothetical protein
MARKSLRPQLNQIRTWTRQGRTDAWVAHQLEVSVQEVEQFKRQNGLSDADDLPGTPVGSDEDEIDLRAADEALIAAELEAAELAAAKAEREQAEAAKAAAEAAESEPEAASAPRTRRRSYRAGSARRGSGRRDGPMEGTFDHGDEGYGLWLDPAISDDPIYAEHWAGHRPVQVTIEEDQIVIRRLADNEVTEDTAADDADPD